MLPGLFQSTTIPLLQEVVNFSQTRHTVLTGNIANMDTPGYEVRDLSVEDFQGRLRAAIQERSAPASEESLGGTAAPPKNLMAEVAKHTKTILHHDKSNVGMEYQVSEMVKNQMQHNLALAVMNQQFRLMQTAIAGRV
jgi:flagellar basal-body rod protein FlgB